MPTLLESRPASESRPYQGARVLVGDEICLQKIVWEGRGCSAEGGVSEMGVFVVGEAEGEAPGDALELKLPYLDAFAAALAREQKAELATADSDFAVLEPKRKILWLD